MATFVKIAQLVLSVALIILVLLQERGSGISESFGGGGGEAGFYQQRRGLDKIIFIATIICLVLFAGASLASLLIR